MSSYNLTHLRQLEAESIHIIREVAAEFENPVMLYSIGKDSAVMLRLAIKAFHPGAAAVSAVARRHDLEVPRDDRVSRPVLPRERAEADRAHQSGRAWPRESTPSRTAARNTPT